MLERAVGDRHRAAAGAGFGEVGRRVAGDVAGRETIVDDQPVDAEAAVDGVGAAGHGDGVVAGVAGDPVAVGRRRRS